MSSQSRYYDMPGNIKIKNGIVHIDMYDEAPDTKAPQNDNPNFVFSERIAMSLPAFVEMYKLMSQAVDNLVDQGILSRQDEEEGTVEINTDPQAAQEPAAAVTAHDAGVADAPKAGSSRRNTTRRKKTKRR